MDKHKNKYPDWFFRIFGYHRVAPMRTCPVCAGKRFIDGFEKSKTSLLCPVCKGDGCVPDLTDSEAIAWGKKFESLKREKR